MAQITPEDENDLRQIRADVDTSAVESVKLERNSRGFNWAIRVVRREDESDDSLLNRLGYINQLLYSRYGR